jgi:hypothetical protein
LLDDPPAAARIAAAGRRRQVRLAEHTADDIDRLTRRAVAKR